jgi:hypothetical protein
VEIDASRFPLIVLRSYGDLSDDELDERLSECDALVERAAAERRYFAVVCVVEGVLSANQRKRMAVWNDARPEPTRRWELDAHFVVRSPLARGALLAITWLTSRLTPIQVHHDEPSAIAAAQASIAAANARRAV